MQNRRTFLKQSCSFCAALAGLGIVAAELESCKSTEGLKVKVTKTQITIPVKTFGDRKNYLVKAFSLPFDVLVVRNPDETYSALQMKCTHKGNPIRVTPNDLVCDKHGSHFDFNGNVTHDPAPTPLTKYPCSVEKKMIVVKLEG